jgi:hypothetical protein
MMLAALTASVRELLGLFSEDGSLALAVIAWLAGAAICIHLIGVDPRLESFLVPAGVVLLLAENVDRRPAAGARLRRYEVPARPRSLLFNNEHCARSAVNQPISRRADHSLIQR